MLMTVRQPKSNRRVFAQSGSEVHPNEQDQGENSQHGVFTLHENHSAFVNSVGNFHQCCAACVVSTHNAVNDDSDQKAKGTN